MSFPNILLVHCHDLGRQLSCYHRTGSATPYLDAFAREGVRFDRAFAAAPNCSPSRGAMMTGRYPHSHGIKGLAHAPFNFCYNEGVKTLPMWLREWGYQTFLFGLQHESVDPATLGYDEMRVTGEGCRCGPVARAAADFLTSPQAHQQPFFASIGFWEIHRWGKRGYPESEYADTPPGSASCELPAGLPEAEEMSAELRGLNRALAAADTAFGDIMRALDRGGLRENTWVIFTTDHGLSFPRAKATLYDAGIETALLMRWPDGFRGGRSTASLCGNVDLLPTLFEGLAQPIPAMIEGVSHWNELAGGQAAARDAIYAEKTFHDDEDVIRAIRTDEFKYIRNFSPRRGYAIPGEISYASSFSESEPRPDEELYALREDPGERQNLAHDPNYQTVKTGLAERLARWQDATNDRIQLADATE